MKPAKQTPCSCGSGKPYAQCCAVPAPEQINALIALYNARRYAELEGRARLLSERYPDFGFGWQLLGGALQMQGKDALQAFHKTAQLLPEDAVAHYNLGVAQKSAGRLDEAVASYRRAISLKPDYVEAHYNLGNALNHLGRIDDAAESFRRSLQLRPDYVDAHSNLLFTLNFAASHSAASFLEEAGKYGRMAAGKVRARFSTWQCAARPERLRVGLVSGDLRKHSVGFFLEDLLAHLDPARIELIAYPTHDEQDELTERIRRHFSAWKPLFGLNDEAAARLIHADGMHVLIDLSGHTKHNRLPVFAWKPAPVQLSWLGLPATTGVAEIDYVLGDRWAIPEQCEDQFSEGVWRLPESYVCLTVPSRSVEAGPLPALSTGYITFGSFNNLTKMNDAVVAVWARILEAVPELAAAAQGQTAERCRSVRTDPAAFCRPWHRAGALAAAGHPGLAQRTSGHLPPGRYRAGHLPLSGRDHQRRSIMDGCAGIEHAGRPVPVVHGVEHRPQCRVARVDRSRPGRLCEQGGGIRIRPAQTGRAARGIALTGAGLAAVRCAALCQELRGRIVGDVAGMEWQAAKGMMQLSC